MKKKIPQSTIGLLTPQVMGMAVSTAENISSMLSPSRENIITKAKADRSGSITGRSCRRSSPTVFMKTNYEGANVRECSLSYMRDPKRYTREP